jgi:tetratricopeptide (TPR) repeat protein
MLKFLTVTLLSLFIFSVTLANDYDDAWKAIHKKDYKNAVLLLQKACKNPSTSLDAYCTLLYLKTYQGKEDEINGLFDALSASPGRNSYLYSMWFNGAVLGSYTQKKPYQLDLIDKIEAGNTFNGSIKTALHYVKAMYYVFSNKYDKGKDDWNQMNSLQTWQFAGPFENLSGSGFNTVYGPLSAADSNATFKGINNVDIKWFTPPKKDYEGWTYCYPSFQQSSAIVYAQTFVYSPADSRVVLNAGVNGSLKVWVNDGLIISDSKERVTELDYYKNYCFLKKGYNRVLVQLGYTSNTMPNFIIRFSDENLLPLKDITSTSIVQPYTKGQDASPATAIRHFAETYFESKIKSEPANLVNYILLSQTYLRNSQITEARQTIEKALKISSEDPLLRFELMQILIKAENRTQLLQEMDWFKENDSGCFINRQMQIQTFLSEEKYDEAIEAVDEMLKIYGDDETILQYKATALAKQEKIDELVKLVESTHKKYPANTSFVMMMFNIKKLLNKDTKAALGVYEEYFKNKYDYTLLQNLASEYKSLGQDSNYLAIIKNLCEIGGNNPEYVSRLSQYYYEKQDYANALKYAQEASSLAPYVGLYWHNIATIYEQMNNTEEAIKNYKKTIYYNRTDYEARKKLTALQKKQEPYKLLPETDVYALIKKSPVDSEYDYTYLLDEKGTILYDEGASEEYITYVVKINTQKGIDTWKEINLGSGNTQSILVEKCEVVKASGSKVAAERNDGTAVFTGLQTGDAIYVKYRLQNYTVGRLGREFWDKYVFNAFVNSQKERYTLIVPKTFLFNYRVINNKLAPTIKDVEDFKIYTWEMNNVPPIKSEPLMPPVNDIATVLHISTIKSWADVAKWYSDIAYQDTKDNYELDALYNDIFKGKINESNYEKAKRIYDYIITNIRYSSVSFRQNGYIPQDISKIINTKLGDCKDLATLFVALANKAGIQAQLVLTDTRDNGVKDMQLPSMEFNHCISLVHIDGKDYYIDLTDSNLPFTSLPANLNGALVLVIPPHGSKSSSELVSLVATNREFDKSLREVNVSLDGNDLKMNVETKRYGSIISSWKNEYASLNAEKQKQSYEEMISNSNKNPVKLETLSFQGLTGTGDSLIIESKYTIKNEVIDAGSIKMIKVPFIDIIATLESLSADKRVYPIEYWNYENTDVYETAVNIQIPAGKKLQEVPSDKNFSFKKSEYSLKFIKTGNQLKVIRRANMNREDITPNDYDEFKKFFNNIVEAESKYIIFQ